MAPDLGWLQQYIEVGFFSDLKHQAWKFYLWNETTYAFFWFNSIAYANLDFVRDACPEAARLALLLRAEERLPAREAEPPLLEYAALAEEARLAERAAASAIAEEQAARRGGGLLGEWPLGYGIDRLRRLTARMAVPEEYSVDVVMPYCDEPLDGLLSRATGYDDEWLSARVPLRHASLLLYRLEVCTPGGSSSGALSGRAALASLPPEAAEAAQHFRSVEVIPVDASPQAWEAARYLLHLASRYDDLADFTLFLHPDVFEHVNPRTLRNVLQALRVGSLRHSGLSPEEAPGGADDGGEAGRWYEYLSLSHHYLTRPTRASSPSSNCTGTELDFRNLRLSIFGVGGERSEEVELGGFGFYCCSQFMVHRDRARRRPREWYRQVAESIPWEHCATSYMELLWHAVFHGGRLHERKRQERTDLPLFLRVDNFLETTSDGLV